MPPLPPIYKNPVPQVAIREILPRLLRETLSPRGLQLFGNRYHVFLYIAGPHCLKSSLGVRLGITRTPWTNRA